MNSIMYTNPTVARAGDMLPKQNMIKISAYTLDVKYSITKQMLEHTMPTVYIFLRPYTSARDGTHKTVAVYPKK
jgi:hypothetical protein